MSKEPIDFDELPMINREIAWLAFNARVLQEAKDKSVPLVSRLQYLAIFSSNLDEFFRVRVASIRALLRLKDKHSSKLNFNPARLLKMMQNQIVKQQRKFGDIFSHSILPGLASHGIVLDLDVSLDSDQVSFVESYFTEHVAEFVKPLILAPDSDPPFLKNKGQYIVAELWPSDASTQLFVEQPSYGLVEIPSETARFVTIPSDDSIKHVLFLDDVIRTNLQRLFPDHEVGESYSVKVTRDAELYIEDEFTGNLVELIRKSLKTRDEGLPTRFLYDMRMSYPMVTALKNYFRLSDEDLVVGGRYHNFSDFFQFPDFGISELVYQPILPVKQGRLEREESILKIVQEDDALIFPPYHSFEYLLKFLNEAVNDSDTSAISITLYRTARDSRIVDSLVAAAKAGISVTAFIEVKARFDEAPNLASAQRMEEAGVRVLYSMPGIKVHAKLLLIQTKSGKAQAYIGTGNFNEKTATLYTDIGLFTSDSIIIDDVNRVFDYLRKSVDNPVFDKLLVAPFSMRQDFEQLIENEIQAAIDGDISGITIKVNSLEDASMITLLYRAANAGVSIRILCRGICCLDTGIAEAKGNIRIVSIVDRYLEHARVYMFANRGNELIYIASADWMKRNLSRRIEVAVPIEDPVARQQISDMMELQLSDNTKARILDSRQRNKFVKSKGQPKVRAQIDTFDYFRSQIEDIEVDATP